MLLTVNALLIVALCVTTAGLAMSYLFASLDRPYLHIVYGTRSRIAIVRSAIWLGAVALSLSSWILVSKILPGTIALGIFFGIVAVLLDICGQRIRYIQLRPYPVMFQSSQHQASSVY